MVRAFVKTYLLVAFAVLVVDLGLGLGRFYSAILGHIFAVLNFPSSVLFLWLERKPNTWWQGFLGTRFGSVVNDEVGSIAAFVIMILVQAFLISVVVFRLRTRLRPVT